MEGYESTAQGSVLLELYFARPREGFGYLGNQAALDLRAFFCAGGKDAVSLGHALEFCLDTETRTGRCEGL